MSILIKVEISFIFKELLKILTFLKKKIYKIITTILKKSAKIVLTKICFLNRYSFWIKIENLDEEKLSYLN